MNDVCPVMVSFLKMAQLTSVCSTSQCVLSTQSAHVHACLVCRKVMGINLTCLTACYGYI